MGKFSQVLLAVALVSCVHKQSSKVQSRWHPISKAKDLECVTWPLREQDLRIDHIALISGSLPGFLVRGMKRDAKPLNYLSFWNDDPNPNPDAFKDLSFPRGSLPIGGFQANGQLYTLFAAHDDQGAYLELREAESNIKSQRFSLKLKQVEEGSLLSDAHGQWLTLKGDDGRYHLFHLVHRGSGAMILRDLTFAIEEVPQITIHEVGAFVMWRDDKLLGRLMGQWFVQGEKASGESQGRFQMDLQGSDPIESWNVARTSAGTFVAVVDGDSLLGEAKLKVAKLDLSSKVDGFSWIGQVDLRDIHVTEPRITETPEGTEVLLLNWVDEESTIARYIVNAEKISKPLFSGLFSRGTRLIESFKSAKSGQIWVLTRHRNDTRWLYQICGL